jgi:mRNA interferase MazF
MANLNPRVGTEVGKIRPVVIIQTDFMNNNHPSTIICPITSQVQPLSKMLRVHLSPDQMNGLEKKSDIIIDQIRTIDHSRLIKRIGEIDTTSAIKLRENLRRIMDL